MNRMSTTVMKAAICGCVAIVLLGSVRICSAQNIAQLIQTFNSLPQDQQTQLINQVTSAISGAGTTGTTTTGTTGTTGTGTTGTTTTDNGTGFPHGKTAIDYVRKNSPEVAVEAARSGNPTFVGQMFQVPAKSPTFWDRVKIVFLDALIQAVSNVLPGLGISLTPTPTPTITGTITPTPTPTSGLTPTPTPTPGLTPTLTPTPVLTPTPTPTPIPTP